MKFRELFEKKEIPSGYYYATITVESSGFTYGLAFDMLSNMRDDYKSLKYDTLNTPDKNDNFYVITKNEKDLRFIWDYLGFNKNSINVQQKS